MKNLNIPKMTIGEMDKAQREMGEKISKELGGCDVECINIGTDKQRIFEIPVKCADGLVKRTSIEFEEGMNEADYAQILASHFISIAKILRDENKKEEGIL